MKRGADKPPHGYVIPGGQRDQTQRRSRRQPAAHAGHRSAPRDRGGRSQGTARSRPARYIVKLNQPYGPLAKTLIEKQAYPGSERSRTYDDSAWTMGMASNIDDQDDRGQERCSMRPRRC